MIGSILLWIALLAVLIGVIWRVAGARGGPFAVGGAPPAGRSAEETLNERYARGEIDRDTYLRMRDDLRDLGGRPPA